MTWLYTYESFFFNIKIKDVVPHITQVRIYLILSTFQLRNASSVSFLLICRLLQYKMLWNLVASRKTTRASDWIILILQINNTIVIKSSTMLERLIFSLGVCYIYMFFFSNEGKFPLNVIWLLFLSIQYFKTPPSFLVVPKPIQFLKRCFLILQYNFSKSLHF